MPAVGHKPNRMYRFEVDLYKELDGRWRAEAFVMNRAAQQNKTEMLGVTPQAAVQRAMMALGLYKRISDFEEIANAFRDQNPCSYCHYRPMWFEPWNSPLGNGQGYICIWCGYGWPHPKANEDYLEAK